MHISLGTAPFPNYQHFIEIIGYSHCSIFIAEASISFFGLIYPLIAMTFEKLWQDLDLCGMMPSSNGNIFRVTGHFAGNSPVPGEFRAQRPVMRSFDIFFDLRLNKRLSKQSWGWWFETPLRPLWRHRNGMLWGLNTYNHHDRWSIVKS